MIVSFRGQHPSTNTGQNAVSFFSFFGISVPGVTIIGKPRLLGDKFSVNVLGVKPAVNLVGYDAAVSLKAEIPQ